MDCRACSAETQSGVQHRLHIMPAPHHGGVGFDGCSGSGGLALLVSHQHS